MILKQTTDYNIFKKVKGNRGLHTKNRKRLKKSIEKNGIQQPILVDEHMFVYDGQHRLDIAKELEMIVPYVISYKTKENCIDELQISEPWSSLQYCEKNADKGCDICVTALDIAEKWYEETNKKFSIINGLTLLFDGVHTSMGLALKNNNYKINYDTANRVYKALHLLKQNQNIKFNPFTATNSRTFKRLDVNVGGLDLVKIKKLTKFNYIQGYSNGKDHYNYISDLYKKYK